MTSIIPQKLQRGDEIRIIAPSRSLAMISEENKNLAVETLMNLGFRTSFSSHSMEEDEFVSSSVESRISDIHEAFLSSSVKAILTVIGGYNSNQLLKYLDYDLIRKHPKILCGYSDITAITNAIYAKTGLVTYSGPHFSTFGMRKGNDYTIDAFKACFTSSNTVEIVASSDWSDDAWYMDQYNRDFIPNEGPFIINSGEAEGTSIGGNLCTFNLLQGTEYFPSLENSIVFLEDDYEAVPHTFDRDLCSLLQQPSFGGVKALLIGRFQKKSQMSQETLIRIIDSKRELKSIPVVANLDFGHTSPLFTFPIGGQVRLLARDRKVELALLTH